MSMKAVRKFDLYAEDDYRNGVVRYEKRIQNRERKRDRKNKQDRFAFENSLSDI